jgi:hypothetical protein
MLPVVPAATERSAPATMDATIDDRLYQLAALTAGAFLLVSLL